MPTADTSQNTRTRKLAGKSLSTFHRLNPYVSQGGRYTFSQSELLVEKKVEKNLEDCCSTNTSAPSPDSTPSGSYTITYVGNGNTSGSAPVDSSSPYTSGSSVAILGNSGTLAKTGYQFAGWNTAADGSGTSRVGDNAFNISANTTLYAQWIIGGARLVYNAGTGGSGTAPVSSGTYYTPYSTQPVVGNTGSFSNGSKAFGGWNTAANGSGTSYPAGSEYTMPGIGTVTLYAQWIDPATTYTVTYNAGTGGSGNVPADTLYYSAYSAINVFGNTGPLTNSDPTKTFYGWNTAANGTGTTYPVGSTFNITANTTLYAQWVSATPQYTVTYEANGATGGSVPAAPANYPGGVQVPILGQGTLTRPGFSFLGWNGSPTGAGSLYAPGYSFSSKTATLYALWAPGSSVKGCGGGGSGGTAGGVTIQYYFPYAQIIQSSDTITIYTTALVGASTSTYGSGDAPLGIVSIASKTVITQTNIQINVNTSYSNPADDYNYSKTITNGVDVTYWPSGTTVSSLTYATLNPSNSNIPTYGISTKTSFNGCGLTANVGSSGTAPNATITSYNFYNQTFTMNFSNGTNTFIAASPNNVLYSTNSGTSWINAPRTVYPYALIVPKSDNALTTITIIPSVGSQYVYPALPDYTVEYNGNGNTSGSLPSPQYMDPYVSGTTSITIRTNSGSLVKSGFTFSGWNTAADGSGTNYATSAPYNGGASLLLYAKWV